MAKRRSRAEPPIRDDERQPLKQAYQIIAQNAANGVRLKDVAQAMGWSMFHLHRRFTLYHGITPKQVMTEHQLQFAMECLRRGMFLADTAKASGFSSQSHFSSRFKSLTGRTPGRWQAEQSRIQYAQNKRKKENPGSKST
jgi:AraC family transcriptional regulator